MTSTLQGRNWFLVKGEVPQLMNWEEYGLRIGVSKGTLSSSETAEVAVVALVGGQFVFPVNTKLVSAVYAVSISKPLLQPLRLEIQHCVNLTRPAQTKFLKFAIAPVNTPSLPYRFSVVEGGQFAVGNWYGSINRNKFCLVCALGEVEQDPQSEGEEQSEGEDPQSEGGSDDEGTSSSDSSDSVKTKDDPPVVTSSASSGSQSVSQCYKCMFISRVC